MISQSHTECTYDPYVPWLGTLVRVFSVVVPLGLEKDHVKDVTDIQFMVLIIPFSCFYWEDYERGLRDDSTKQGPRHRCTMSEQMHPSHGPLFPYVTGRFGVLELGEFVVARI